MTKILIPEIKDIQEVEMSKRELIISNLVRNKSYLISLDVYANYRYKIDRRSENELVSDLDTYRDSHIVDSYDIMDYEIEKLLNKNQIELEEDLNNDPDYAEVVEAKLAVVARFYNHDYDYLEESIPAGQSTENAKLLYELQDEMSEIFNKYTRFLKVEELIKR